jgi:uroporphyrinogen-III synthase
VLITRAANQAKALADPLQALGAVPLFLPGLQIEPPQSLAPVEAALGRLANFDWIVFTSQNAVRAFAEQARQAGKDLSLSRLAAIGPKTARALAAEGLAVALVAKEAVAESIAASLVPQVQGKRVLLPRAEQARELLPEELRRAGALEVCDLPVYRAMPVPSPAPAEVLESLRRGEIDAVTFASARTVAEVVEKLEAELGADALAHLARCRVFTIGPSTTRACAALGLSVARQADPHTIDGMVQAIVEALGP